MPFFPDYFLDHHNLRIRFPWLPRTRCHRHLEPFSSSSLSLSQETWILPCLEQFWSWLSLRQQWYLSLKGLGLTFRDFYDSALFRLGRYFNKHFRYCLPSPALSEPVPRRPLHYWNYLPTHYYPQHEHSSFSLEMVSS